MEKNDEARRACASCKHQRKKCRPNCLLAPFFPAENSHKFQAVHKVFGVSNVQKMIRELPAEVRSQAAQTLIWEAEHRLNDPVNGCFAEYRRVTNELKELKDQFSKFIECKSNPDQNPCLRKNNYINNSMGFGPVVNDGMHNFQFSGGLPLDPTYLAGLDNVAEMHSINGLHQDYNCSDQYNMFNVNSLDQ